MMEWIARNYLLYEHPLAQAQLALFMLGMGATLTVRDFAVVFRQPRRLTYGLICVLLLTPPLAVLVAEIADLSTGVALGLLLVGTLSGGTLSNFYTYLARANLALSIALSGCGAILSMATVPILLRLLAGEFVPPDFQMPVGDIIREIFLFMLLPLLMGMSVARFAHRYRTRFAQWAIWMGVVLLALMVVGSLSSGRITFSRYDWSAIITVVVFAILLQQLSMLAPRILGWPTRDFAAIGLEAAIRNVYLGVLVGAILFPATVSEESRQMGGDVIFVVLFYGASSLCVCLPLALRMRLIHRHRPKPSESASV